MIISPCPALMGRPSDQMTGLLWMGAFLPHIQWMHSQNTKKNERFLGHFHIRKMIHLHWADLEWVRFGSLVPVKTKMRLYQHFRLDCIDPAHLSPIRNDLFLQLK